jgi:small GTP-binding protein
MMDRESLAMVLVGHVDHGKSTLIGRLLHDTDSLPEGKLEEVQAAARAEGREMEFGFIMDHLREERQRGVTIDTAQTFFSSPKRDYVIIDAPGHKEFIRNMITGASQAEAAVLICSVPEGVQEQTRRHAYVIKLLGLRQVIVAYNKMDLVDYKRERFRKVKADMDAVLRRLLITPSVEVPISAHCGDNVAQKSENMAWHDGPSVVESLDLLRKDVPANEKPVRFPVQDVYLQNGSRIVAGRVESGVLRSGQRLRFLPQEEDATVLRILAFNEPDLERAEAGQCIGAIFDRDSLVRGQVGCQQDDVPHMTARFRASVFWLSPAPASTGPSGDILTLKCATQEQPCRISELCERIDSGSLEHLDADAARLQETEVGHVVIETEAPVVLESFYDVQELGRFVLLRGHNVVAGGIVTKPDD